ncbi:MAG: PilZ domain-containing protein [Archangium sp.]|nr:PilZ domain-containing protein [Archangium sp.]
MSLERRQALRANVVIAVEVRDARGFSLHSTRDISSGGLYFDRAIPHSVGARVQLAFTLPGDTKSIRCDGEVVNVPDKKGYGMGIRFLDIAPADADRIEEFAKESLEGTS